jgi:hypothetical protein
VPVIQYVGPYDRFNCPRWRIPDSPARTPIEVSDEAYADLITQPANYADVEAPKKGKG